VTTASQTYYTLWFELKRFAEDDDSEFLAALPGVITRGETRVVRDLNLRHHDTKTTVQAETITGYASLHTSTISVRDVSLSATGQPLERRATSFVTTMALQLPSGNPEFYTEDVEYGMHVAPIPSGDVNLTVWYSAPVETLSDTQSETYVSKTHGDLLLASCLVEVERYNKNLEAQQIREMDYQKLLVSSRADTKGSARAEYTPVASQPAASPQPKRSPNEAI